MSLLQAVQKGDLEYVTDNIDSDTWFKNTPWSDYILLNNSIEFNRFKVSTFLLEKNCRVNRTDLTVPENTPLHWAISKHNVELVIQLLRAGASLIVRDENGDTPVHLAGQSKKPVQMVNALMPYVIAAPNLVNRHGLSHLHVACMSDQQRLTLLYAILLDINVPVHMDAPWKPGYTPLHFALCYGRSDISNFLWIAGADAHVTDAHGVTPFHLAFRKKQTALLYLMMLRYVAEPAGGEYVNLVDDMDISYFHIFCSQNDWDIILDKYLELGVDVNGCISVKSSYLSGYSPLHVAVQYNCTNTIRWLLRHGADVTERNTAGYTPVHLALQLEAYDLIELFVHEMVKVGKRENPADKYGITFFHLCCMTDNPDVVQDFVNSGWNIDMRTKLGSSWLAGCTPLHLAVRFEKPGVVEVLLKNHANVYAVDAKGETPLHYLCQWNTDKIDALAQIVEKIIRGVRPLNTIQAYLNKRLQMLQSFVDLGVKVDVFDKSNLTPLFHLFNHRAEVSVCNRLFSLVRDYSPIVDMIDRNRVEMFKMMLKLKPNFGLGDRSNSTLLHLLAYRHFMHFVPHQREIVPPMLENGENVDALNNSNVTALYLAATNGNEELVEILLEKSKPDVNFFVRDDELGTPVAGAIHFLINCMHKPNIVNRLIERGADVNVRLNNGSTALHLIFGCGIFAELCRYMTLPVIICDLEIRESGTGRTPLHLATRAGDANAVDWLLRAGANVNLEDDDGLCPIENCISEPLRTGTAYVKHHRRLLLAGLESPPILSTFVITFDRFIETDTQEFEQQCLEEVERLKDRVINQYCTMYNFLSRSIHSMAYYVNNEEVSAMLRDQHLCNEFPQYGPLIANKFRRALARHKIQNQAVNSFSYLLKLPEIIGDRVLALVADTDATSFIRLAEDVDKEEEEEKQKKSVVRSSSTMVLRPRR